ncbi:hypothetical protein Ddc_05991 [Ditylenchus destructor]|nr:hypothetical protein Ddc_05991 [Ditylenchus destructor]
MTSLFYQANYCEQRSDTKGQPVSAVLIASSCRPCGQWSPPFPIASRHYILAPKLRSPRTSKSRARSQSTSSTSRKAKPASPKKKSPKKTPSKAKQPKTPSPSKSRSRSTSRSRKIKTAPPAPQARSRSRSRTASTSRKPAQKASLVSTTVSSGSPQRPSSSLAHYIQQQQPRLRPRGASSSISSQASSLVSSVTGRSPRSTVSRGASTISNAVFNNRVAQKLRRILSFGGGGSKRCWTKTKKHIKNHWKAYFFIILSLVSAYFAYKCSKEIASQLKQISNTITEYVEVKKKIFGEYAEQAARALEEAKNQYFPTQEEQPTIKPFDHLEKPKDVPHHQTTPPTVAKTVPHVDKSKHTINDGP